MKELIAGVAKLCVVVRSAYTACVITVIFQLFCLLFVLLYIVDCVLYCILLWHLWFHEMDKGRKETEDESLASAIVP